MEVSLEESDVPEERQSDLRSPADARLSAGGDFEACLFAQTSFCLARPIRSIDKELIETFAAPHEKARNRTLRPVIPICN